MESGNALINTMAGYDGIIGHDVPLSVLSHLLRENRLPSTLLFTGTGRVGKLATAVQLAKNLLCTKTCDTLCDCYSCNAIRHGTHPDVVVISKDSQFKVDDMREIVSVASMKVTLGHQRIVIIDKAENLKQEAANAALKTFEEPGENVRFFLVADNESYLLPTVRSRSYRLKFAQLSKSEMMKFASNLGDDPENPETLENIGVSMGRPGEYLKWSKIEGFRQLYHDIDVWLDETINGTGRYDILSALNWKKRFWELAKIAGDLETERLIPRGANVREMREYFSDPTKFPINVINWKIDEETKSRLSETKKAVVLSRLMIKSLAKDRDEKKLAGLIKIRDFIGKMNYNCSHDIALERLYFQICGH